MPIEGIMPVECTVVKLDVKTIEISINQEIKILSETCNYHRTLDLTKPIYYIGHDGIGARFSNQLNLTGEVKGWDYLTGSTLISFGYQNILSEFYK